jgi:hypothetical protein
MKIGSLSLHSTRPAARAASLTVVCAIGLFSNVATARAENSFASIARSYFDKALDAAKAMVKSGESRGDNAAISDDPEEAALESALAAGKSEIFLTKGGYEFTQSRWGAQPTPYQLEGLELVPLPESPVNGGDQSSGIDRRLTYEFRARNHRRFYDQTGWGRWTPGVPPHLDTITLVRENGIWKVASSPLWAYSLK